MTHDPDRIARIDAGVLRVRGDDCVTWLQGQITQDVHALVEGASTRAFHLTSDGKIEDDLLVVRDAGGFTLLALGPGRRSLAERLDRRVVMEDVTLASGDDAVFVVFGAVPSGATTVGASERFGPHGSEVCVPRGEVDAFVARAADSGLRLVDADGLEEARVRAAAPSLGVDFAGDLPQETGLAARTVSFTKGCYVGQEPVVMLEHRGKPRRRMAKFSLPVHVPAPATLTDALGAEVGTLTSSTRHAPYVGLGQVKRAAALVGAELRAGTAPVQVTGFVGDEGSPPHGGMVDRGAL